ncbi:MAG TPA: enoyl-CoA hydratase/isomerase family protein [Myxococcota bacterium]|nr:enoyl-CoA hydratase/isomerase family protein [Myxococcota bacterium]
MSDPAVLYEEKDHVATITLNRPENRNSMTEDVLEGLRAAVARVKEDASLRCVIVTGRGKSFCAGADFRSQIQRSDVAGERKLLPNERSFAMYSPFLSLLQIEVPVIGALNGHAIGGGLGLALVCDIRVANREAKYGANFTKLGLHPGMATTYFLPRFVGVPRAAELLFTGRLVSGEEAARLGLANYAVAEDQVLPKSQELAREVASCAPIAVRWTKRSLYQNVDWDPVSAAQAEAHAQSRTLETEDSKEGVQALLQKREPVFRGR